MVKKAEWIDTRVNTKLVGDFFCRAMAAVNNWKQHTVPPDINNTIKLMYTSHANIGKSCKRNIFYFSYGMIVNFRCTECTRSLKCKLYPRTVDKFNIMLFFMTTWFDFLQDVVLIFNKFNHFRNRMKHKNIHYSFQKRQLPVAFVVHSGVQQSTHQSTSRQLDSVMNNMESSFLGHKPKIKYSLLSPTRKRKEKTLKLKVLLSNCQISNDWISQYMI